MPVLEKTKYHYDKKTADKAVFFISHLKHTKGRWAGKFFKLLPWQETIIRDVFGTLREDGTRRYRIVYTEIPKKNGKSELCAGIALYMLLMDGEPSAEVYGAACDKNQAAIVFNVAAQMVNLSPNLSNKLKVRDSVKRIIHERSHSVYRVLSADVKNKHGFNTSCCVFDEIHAQPNRDLWDVLTEGSGAARTQPLFMAITTAGIDRNSICWELHERARRILTGIVDPEDDPTFYPVIYGPPDDEAGEEWDWGNEDNWKAVNPSLGETIKLDDLREDYKQAVNHVEKENLFKQLRLNIWVKQSTRWIKMSDWDKCRGKVELDELKGRECYAGLDLSTSIDLTALSLVFPFPDGHFKTLMRFWIPQDAATKKEKTDHVPFTRWIHEGLVSTTPGNLIDYSYIRHDINELRKIYNIKELAYDRWGAVKLITDLQEDGFAIDQKSTGDGHPLLVPFGQGYVSMSPPAKELITLILGGKLEHGGNPVLRWNANNAVVAQDPAGNIKPDKAKATERIDGIVALLMGLDRAMRHPQETESVYESRGALIF
jgi:phage terminase large subunit-like protein